MFTLNADALLDTQDRRPILTQADAEEARKRAREANQKTHEILRCAKGRLDSIVPR